MEEETKEEIKPNGNQSIIPTTNGEEFSSSIALESYESPLTSSPKRSTEKFACDDTTRRTLFTPSYYIRETQKHMNKIIEANVKEDTSKDSKHLGLKTPSTPGTPDHINFVDDDEDSSVDKKSNKAAVWKTLFERCRWNKPSWTRLSSFIVRNAPCFWCCSKRLDVSATHRSVLLRLNVLCGFFASGQIAAGIFLVVVLLLHDNDNLHYFRTNLWNLNSSIFTLGLIGIVLLGCVFFTRRIIRRVNLVGAIRYLWILMWILPLELFLSISLFDYHRVTHVWIRHWWHTESFDWFRNMFCIDDTAYSKCKPPLEGGYNYSSVEEWCIAEYNATDCKPIMDAAQSQTKVFFYSFYTFFATWGLCLVILLFLAIQTLEELVTIPIAEKSRTSNIPIWFALPIIISFFMGFIMQYAADHEQADDKYFWVSFTYYISGAIFTIGALLGWLISAYRVWSARDNRNRQIAVILFLITMFLAVLSLASIFVASLMYSVNLIHLGYTEERRGSISCFLDQGANSCTGCNMVNIDPASKCKEWHVEEIMNVYRTIFKLSASVAAIMLIYAFGGLRYGFSLKKHLSLYQIDYV